MQSLGRRKLEQVDINKLDSRELDMLVAEYVFGLHVEVVKPTWYDREVMLFISPESGLIIYSYDTNGCNAMMYRNGVDSKDGIAEPLPFFSLDDTIVWEIIDQLRGNGWRVNIHVEPESVEVNVYCPFGPCKKHGTKTHNWHGATASGETLPLALCRAALKALMEVRKNA